ncbi:hypothetical protein Fmac_010927 [Flemingia macrophylla]|uniref:Uncharacterized protein n=1 Tax=Flemingia macrophylla TaxID=520843 RepID=A0ABD1ML92_9FABA
MRPLQIGFVFGLGTMFGAVMSRGAQRFRCHKAGHHPSSCHPQPRGKEISQGSPQDLPALQKNPRGKKEELGEGGVGGLGTPKEHIKSSAFFVIKVQGFKIIHMWVQESTVMVSSQGNTTSIEASHFNIKIHYPQVIMKAFEVPRIEGEGSCSDNVTLGRRLTKKKGLSKPTCFFLQLLHFRPSHGIILYKGKGVAMVASHTQESETYSHSPFLFYYVLWNHATGDDLLEEEHQDEGERTL